MTLFNSILFIAGCASCLTIGFIIGMWFQIEIRDAVEIQDDIDDGRYDMLVRDLPKDTMILTQRDRHGDLRHFKISPN